MVAESDYLRLVSIVRAEHGVTREQIESHDRCKKALFGRRIIAICLREQGYSLPEIGEAICRDHTTVLRMIRDDPRQAVYRRLRRTARVEAMKIVERLEKHPVPKPGPRVRDANGKQMPRWQGESMSRLEDQYRRAVEAYWSAPAYDREKVWETQMRSVFPHSWERQVIMLPRAA